jgi:hypothetical protein
VSRADRKAGYAILGVLLITALAVLAGGALLSVALSAADVAHGDQENEAACAAAETGLSDALERLRWGWADDGSASGTVTVGLPGGESYSFTCRTSAPTSAGTRPQPVYQVEVVGRCGAACVQRACQAWLVPDALPAGVTVAGDVQVLAPTTVAGCGVYAGGSVFGRQLITFADGAGSGDAAHPELWPQAGAHAAAGIFTDAGEVHGTGCGAFTDSDAHAGVPPPAELVTLPAAPQVAALATHATSAGAALEAGTLHLDRLPAFGGAGAVGVPSTGLLVVVSAGQAGQRLRIVGRRPAPPAAAGLTLIVVGDATVVADDDEASCDFTGALVVTGDLAVAAPLSLDGSLAAASLSVGAELHVSLDQRWRAAPPAGYARVVVAAPE